MELTHVDLQTVQSGGVVTYDTVAVKPGCYMAYREDSGQITLKGQNNARRRFLVDFEANVSLPATDGTPAANSAFDSVQLAITINGEPVESTRRIKTPAFLSTFNSIGVSTYIDTFCGCCVTVAVENLSGTPIELRNVKISAIRTA